MLLLAISAASLAAGVPYFTEPALCPTRPEIAFVSGGDIWVAPSKGGEAHLLVSHPADESRPLYSPDGNKLAFVSTRTGNGDIYVLMLGTLLVVMVVFLFIREPGIDNLPRRTLSKRTLWGTFWEAVTAHSHHPDYPAEIAVSSEKRDSPD